MSESDELLAFVEAANEAATILRLADVIGAIRDGGLRMGVPAERLTDALLLALTSAVAESKGDLSVCADHLEREFLKPR